MDRYEIYYSTNDCQMNNKPHDFYLHELSILGEQWTWSWSVDCFDISGVISKVTINTSVCWAAILNVERTYILKMEFIIS